MLSFLLYFTLSNSYLNSHKIHLDITMFYVMLQFNIFIVNIYNNHWNFFLLKMWFISTAWKATLYIVISYFLMFSIVYYHSPGFTVLVPKCWKEIKDTDIKTGVMTMNRKKVIYPGYQFLSKRNICMWLINCRQRTK